MDEEDKLGEELLWAVGRGDLDEIESLIKKGADISYGNGSAMAEAASSNNYELVKWFLKHPDFEYDDDILQASSHMAASVGNLEMFKLFLILGADPHSWENMAIEFATGGGHQNIIDYIKRFDFIKKELNNPFISNHNLVKILNFKEGPKRAEKYCDRKEDRKINFIE
jgi:ankyrin repeat protein